MSGTTRKTTRKVATIKSIHGPEIAMAIVSALQSREARSPERCVAVNDLAELTGLATEAVSRIAPHIVLGTYAVLPFSDLDRGLVGFCLANDAWADLAAEFLLDQAHKLRLRADALNDLSRRMRSAKSPSEPSVGVCESGVKTRKIA